MNKINPSTVDEVWGLYNNVRNINAAMKTLHQGKKLHPDQKKQIIEFYQETSLTVAHILEDIKQ